MTTQVQTVKVQKTKPYNPLLHSFRLGMRQNAAVTIVVTLVFLILYTAVPAIVLITDNTRPGAPYPVYNYLFLCPQLLALHLFPWLALASALLQGVLSFRFLYGRKSSITWFSLGLSRSDLFWSRFAAGATGALLPAVVSLTVTLGFNLALSPAIWLVLARYAFFLIGICLQILVLYSIAAAVCVRVATKAEATVYSFTLCLLPSITILGMNALMEKLLFGTPYAQPSYYSGGFNLSPLRILSDWNPLLFFSPYMSVLGSEPASIDARNAALMSMLRPNSVNWLMLLGWALAAAVIVWLARWLFLRRRAEIAGRAGASRALGTACVLTVGFGAFGGIYSLPFYLPKNLAFWAPFAGALGAAFTVMLAVALPLRLFKRPRWIGFTTVFGGLAAMAALAGIFATGGLGYSGYVPDVRNVQSVTVSYNGLNDYVQQYELEQSGFISWEFRLSPCVTLTDEADIRVLTGIHRNFVSTGKLDTVSYSAGSPTIYDVMFRIRYTLKSGAVVERVYQGLTAELMKNMIALDDTAEVKQAYADSFLNPRNNPDLDNVEAYANGTIYLCSPFCSTISSLEFASDERAELLECIANDLAAQPAADRYLPDEPPVCMLEFAMTSSHDTIEDLIKLDGTKPVYVTRRFARTLAFLNRHSIEIPEENADHICIFEYTNSYLPFDSGNHLFPIYTTLYIWPNNAADLEREDYAKRMIYGTGQMQEILSRCRSIYLKSEGGYPVLIKLKGSDQYVTAFLPAADAPDFVKESLK